MWTEMWFGTSKMSLLTYFLIEKVPEEVISKEEFDVIHIYVITKPDLKDSIITV